MLRYSWYIWYSIVWNLPLFLKSRRKMPKLFHDTFVDVAFTEGKLTSPFLPICLSVCSLHPIHSPSPFIPVSFSPCITLSVCVCPSVRPSVCFSLSLSLSLSPPPLPPSLSLSLPPPPLSLSVPPHFQRFVVLPYHQQEKVNRGLLLAVRR